MAGQVGLRTNVLLNAKPISCMLPYETVMLVVIFILYQSATQHAWIKSDLTCSLFSFYAFIVA